MKQSNSRPESILFPFVENAANTKRITDIFYWFIGLILLGLVAYTLIALSTIKDHLPALFTATSILPVAACLWLVQRRRFELAAALLGIVLNTVITLIATNEFGIYNLAILGYPIILIVASVFTRRRVLIPIFLYNLLCIAWLVLGQQHGLFTPHISDRSVIGDVLTILIILVITTIMVRLITRTMFQSFNQLESEFKQRENAEENYRAIFENAIDGIFQSTPDGRFIQVNPAMARIYGYDSPEDMIENVTNIGERVYVDPQARLSVRKELEAHEQVAGFESLEYRKDGSTIWVSTNMRAVRDEVGNIRYYEGTVEDITPRKQMEIKQKEAETLYRMLVENTSVIVYRDATDNEGSTLYISPQVEKMLGYSAELWTKNKSFWKTLVHPDDLPGVLMELKNYIANKDSSSIEYRLRAKDGEWRWVRDETVIVKDQNGEAQYVQGVLFDITVLKQAEDSLRQFRKLMDESNDGIFLIDPQTSRYIDFNRSAYEKLGYNREELLQLGVIDIAQHVADMEVWQQRVALVSQQGGLIFESVYKRKDETLFPVEVSARMLNYEGRTVMVAIVRDISERKRAEIALRESEERFRRIFNSSPIAICITTLEEGRLLDANRAYWELTGESAEASIGLNAEQLKSWDDLKERSRFVQELREKHSVTILDDDFFHPDGSLKHVMSFYEYILIGDEECILSMYYDMSTQKQLEMEREQLIQQLEVQNAESETMRESLASILSTFEFDEIIQHILDQIRRVVPYDSASIWRLEGNLQRFIGGRGELPRMFYESEVIFEVDEENSAGPILTGKVPYILNNNVQEELADFQQPPHNYVNSWLALPLKTRGQIIGLIALDGKKKNQFNQHHAELAVTFGNQVAIALENSRLFRELQAELLLREQLIHELESKNAELERFTYTVSHDLKSPLVTINGFLGYLTRDAETGNVQRLQGDLQRIQDAVHRMHRLLNELLELSRIGRVMRKPEKIIFDDLVHEVLELTHGRLEQRRVSVQTHPNLPAVYGDRQRLTECLQNLVDNAAKFMGSQIDPRIEIGQRGEEEGKPLFFVRDNGVGISPEYHEKIFGLFNTLDAATEGTGIGLALVKRIIEVHGGRIWVESEIGKGATFYFSLPPA